MIRARQSRLGLVPPMPRALGALGALGVLACAPAEEGPRWSPIQEGETARVASVHEARPIRSSLGREWSVKFRGDEAWLSAELRREDWSKRPIEGIWRATVEARGYGRPPGGAPAARLEGADVRFAPWDEASFKNVPDDTFAVGVDAVVLKLAPGTEPPDRLRLALRVGRGAHAGGRRRIVGKRFTGDGLSVWPGERLELEREVEGPTTLRFATTVEPFVPSEAEPGEPVRFRLLVDGREAFVHAATAGREEVAHHAVPLPGEGRRTLRLAFEVEGRFAFTNVLTPVLGPTEVGTYGARPWKDERPDLLLFVADTFRADNLGAYGSELGLTPRLDDLARRGLVFERTWSTSTYTLPAHASMFTGRYPRPIGITRGTSSLAPGVRTIAGELAASGYRVGGVTDKGYLTPSFGLDRGHPFFDVLRETMAETRQRVRSFLEADDGRPVFLLAHTYRVHGPYEVSPGTRRELGERLGIVASYEELSRRRKSLEGHRQTSEWEDVMRKLRAYYLGGVADFDRELGLVLDDLEELGFFRNGVLVFTSDHGEAFDENGEVYHAGNVWEAQVRVPLVLYGPRIAPGRNPWPASLVDVAPTLAALAGLPPDPDWDGRSLLENEDARPLYLFRSYGGGDDSTFGVVDGGRKVMGYESLEALHAGKLFGAFDLARDPHEEHDLAGEEAWPSELLRRHVARLETLLKSPTDDAERALDPEARADLSGLGYAGDGH